MYMAWHITAATFLCCNLQATVAQNLSRDYNFDLRRRMKKSSRYSFLKKPSSLFTTQGKILKVAFYQRENINE